MSDETNNQSELNQSSTDDSPQPAAGVTLAPEQYEALLDRLAELEEIAKSQQPQAKKGSSLLTLDELVNEGRGANVPQRPSDADLDSFSNTQLTNHILNEVSNIGNKIMVEIQTQKVLREIDKCESKHSDFWQYEKEIYDIATKNPTLTVEQAYQLAKSSVEPKGEIKDGEKTVATPLTQKILNLPPRPSFGGEKPGAAPAATRESGESTSTLRAAASAAWDEVVGKGKTNL